MAELERISQDNAVSGAVRAAAPSYNTPRPIPAMRTETAPQTRTAKRKPQAKDRDVVDEWQDNLTFGAIGLCAALWMAAWVVNGHFSVIALERLFGVTWYAGWLAQIVATVIEAYLWRVKLPAAYAVLIGVCFCDVLSSAVGLVAEALERGYARLPAADGAILAGVTYPYGVATIAAMVMALAVEPALTALARYALAMRK